MQLSVGFASRPFRHLPPCGDGWFRITLGDLDRFMLADGIGHGSKARVIVDLLGQHLDWICRRTSRIISLCDCMQSLHEQLRAEGSACQAAVALMELDRRDGELHVVSIGNVEVHVQTPDVNINFPSIRGMVGGIFPRTIHESPSRLEEGGLICLVSDGVVAERARQHVHGLRHHSQDGLLDIQLEAQRIVESCGSVNDDASCLLVQMSPGANR